jgi:hypothetical protein
MFDRCLRNSTDPTFTLQASRVERFLFSQLVLSVSSCSWPPFQPCCTSINSAARQFSSWAALEWPSLISSLQGTIRHIPFTLRKNTNIICSITGAYQGQFEHHQGAAWTAVVFIWLYAIHFGYSWVHSTLLVALLLLTLRTDGALSLGSSSPKSSPLDYVPKAYRLAAPPTGSTT